MSRTVEEIALRAIREGVRTVERSDFRPGEPLALATDAFGDDAAALVVRLEPDGGWTIDVARFVADDGAWTDVGSSGATYGDLPLEPDVDVPPEILLFTRGTSGFDNRHLAYAGGFVTGPVDEVELVSAAGTRRVPIGVNRHAFVVLGPGDDESIDRRSLRRDCGPFVRAYARGLLVDDSAEWHREDDPFPEALTVAEAVAVPSGKPLTVRGVLLQLEGRKPVLCDDVDTDVSPPKPNGPALVLDLPPGPLSWRPGSAGVTTLAAVVRGVVRGDELVPLREQRLSSFEAGD